MTLFERIKFVTKKRGKTIREVALAAGFNSESAIYRYNQGVNPRKATLEAIARAIPTSVEFLEGKTDNWQIDVNDNVTANDEAEAKVLTMFRKSTEGMNEDEKLRFQQSLDKLMSAAKDLNNTKE